MTRYIHKHLSMHDFVESAKSRADHEGASHKTDDGEWSGTKTFDQAVHLATHGWSDIRPKVDVMLEPIRERLAEKLDVVPERHHDLIGYEPDIDRYLAGEVECMWEDMLTEAPRNGRVHILHISGCVPWFISAETLAKRGAALVALCEAFTICGAELEIWCESSVEAWGGYGKYGGEGDQWSSLIRVQRAGDPLDVNNLMYPLAHPSFLRRLVFAEMEGEMGHVRDKFGFREHGGYGRVADFLVSDQIEASFQMSRGGKEMGEGSIMDRDPVQWVLNTLEAQGVWEPHDYHPS